MNKFPLLRAGQGMEITLAGNCIEFASTVAPPIVARITGTAGTNDAGATIYTWEEMSPDTTGSAYEVTRGGRTGNGTSNPAYELNNATAEIGTIVLLRVRGSGSDSQGQAIFEFSLCGGGNGTTVSALRVIADWTSLPDYQPIGVSGVGTIYYAYLFSDAAQTYSAPSGYPSAFVLPTVGGISGTKSTTLAHLGDYLGVLTALTHEDPLDGIDKPIYLVPNSYFQTYVPYLFACGDNGLQVTYQTLRIPNGISLGFNTP